MISELRDFLIRERAAFEVIGLRDTSIVSAPTTPSAADGRRLAKVVTLRDGDSYTLAVLPAGAALDLTRFRRRIGRYALAVADEDGLRNRFPELADGPLPPFGRMLGIPVYLDRDFAEETTLIFESGAHGETMSIPMREYVRVERPAIAPLARALRAA